MIVCVYFGFGCLIGYCLCLIGLRVMLWMGVYCCDLLLAVTLGLVCEGIAVGVGLCLL